MWHDFNGESFLPGEGEQAATAAAADVRERLAMVEDQLKSQYTSMAAYAQISQQAIDTARAESRADLDREKATVISLVEQLREELHCESAVAVSGSARDVEPIDAGLTARVAMLEERFELLSQQFAQTLKCQEDLANSIAFMFEQQARNSGWLANCAATA
jgi:hypothetical protein